MDKEEKKIKVLIVDDEAYVRVFVSESIRRIGFVVETADNGEVGFDKALHGKPDIIILDVTMPLMDGLEVYKRLREIPLTRNIPVIFFSGQYTREIDKIIQDKPKAIVKYIEKPCDIQVLLKCVNDILPKVKTTP